MPFEKIGHIKCKYRCKECKLDEFIFVRPRKEEEEIKSWVGEVATQAGYSHTILSPKCPQRHLDILFPITKKGIGFEGEPLSDEEMADVQKQLEKK